MAQRPTYEELQQRVRDLEKAESERKAALEALGKSEARYRRLFDSNPQPMWIYDLETLVFMAVNDAAIAHYGYSRAEFLCMTLKDIRPREDVPRLLENIAAVANGLDQAGIWRHLTKDGRVIDVEITSHVLTFDRRRAELVMVNDVTERQRIRRENTRRQRFLESILSQAPDAIIALDSKHRVLDWNQGAVSMFGYTREEALGADLDDLITRGEQCEQAKVKTRQILDGRRVDSFETMRFRKDGTPLRVIASGSPLIVNGVLEGIVAVYTDISERVRTEAELRQSEERLRNIIEHSSNLFYSHTPDHELTYVSPQSSEYFQCEPEEAMVRWTEFVTDNPLNRMGFELTEKAIRTGRRQAPYELELVGKKGRKSIVEIRESPIVENGRTVAIVGSLTDVTERKRAEEALRKSHEGFLTVLNSIDATIYVADMHTHEILFMNRNMIESFGRDMTGEICWKAFRGEAGPCLDCTSDQLVDEKGRPTGVYIWDGRNAITDRWYINYDRAIEWIDGRMVRIQVATDISDLKQMEEVLRQAHKMEAIGTLAGGIAHDFNNILMGIQGRASILSAELGPCHPQREHSEAIEEYVKSAAALSKQLLGFARKGRYHIQPLDISKLMLSAAEMFGRTHKEIRIHKKTHTAPLVVEADEQQIEQVLLNLFINAWQAMPEGGEIYLESASVGLDCNVCRLHDIEPGRYAKISVADTGIGMDMSTMQRVFDPFFTTKEKDRGTGLGLASVYGIVKNHGGIVNVSSELGCGTTFEIYLPISDRKIRPKPPVDQELLKGVETVLLVDDESIVIDVGKKMLQKLGYRVITVDSGERAVDAIRQKSAEIDLVILDMIMPGIDGGKTFDAIRGIKPDIPVILSSGYSLEGQATEIMQRGCNGFIQKPFNISQLSKIIRKNLNDPSLAHRQ